MFLFIDRRSVYFHNDEGALYEIQKVTGCGRKATWLINDKIYKGNLECSSLFRVFFSY